MAPHGDGGMDMDMDMAGMDMSHGGGSSSSSGGSSGGMMMMMSIFQTSPNTPLYSMRWTPTTAGGYAATCIFLIVLATLLRVMLALKAVQESRWLDRELQRRYVAVKGSLPMAERVSNDSLAKQMTLTANGVEEQVMVVKKTHTHLQPWRFSVDPLRAVIDTVIAGVGYLLYASPPPPRRAFALRAVTNKAQHVGGHDDECRLLSIGSRRRLCWQLGGRTFQQQHGTLSSDLVYWSSGVSGPVLAIHEQSSSHRIGSSAVRIAGVLVLQGPGGMTSTANMGVGSY